MRECLLYIDSSVGKGYRLDDSRLDPQQGQGILQNLQTGCDAHISSAHWVPGVKLATGY
jgi:hypothetical protein